jgi:hypothetical protein
VPADGETGWGAGRRPGRWRAGAARPAQRSGRGWLAWVLVATGACYAPHIVPNGLKCAASPNACPDGFTCVAGVCAGAGGAGGRGGQGAAGNQGGMSGMSGNGGASCPNAITPLCSGDSSQLPCDPVCQTGCPCGMRCAAVVAAGAGGAGGASSQCVVPAAVAPQEGEVCDPTNDVCAPGFVCSREPCGGPNFGRCYRLCRDIQPTPASGPTSTCSLAATCNSRPGLGLDVCGLPTQTGVNACDPYANTGCLAPLNCNAVGFRDTFCDCPPASPGRAGDGCLNWTQCDVQLICLKQSNTPSTCFTLCKSSSPDCPNCMSLGAGAFSYCATP